VKYDYLYNILQIGVWALRRFRSMTLRQAWIQ